MSEPRLHLWLAERLPDLASRLVDEFGRRVPYYAEQPREVLDGQLRPAIEANLRIAVKTLRQQRTFTVDERAEVIDWSARRAEQGVPLEAVLTAYHLAIELCWQALVEEADEEEARELGALALHFFGYLRSVVPAVALAHAQEGRERYGELRAARRAVLDALLAGAPADAPALRAGVPLAAAYDVLVLRGDPDPDPAVTRQLTRQVQSVLDAHAGGHVLAMLDGMSGTALLPAKGAPDAACGRSARAGRTPARQGGGDGPADALESLVGRIVLATDRAVTVTTAPATGAEAIPGALREASEVAELVLRLGRPPGLYRMTDVLLEYQIARPGNGLAQLAARLDPLDDRPELMETLRVYVDQGHNRRRAAETLQVHRNTLDYRLRGIAALTGLDPSGPELAAALTARALR
ncbi:PucR family transcriptional regulator [Actinocorallia sp. A-T 12471]|uniref:PucR family transcriptional regulator n=1 Tax=Actinocorallia sp. A-T 12471 TaxID=3089813 RepID=UPI0029CC4252|nr:helix-turn-helix domain-containing protein [Actinocorallia sp. A-T 12471]MDX6741850.1 helix-turn-helix domain-containing protein [Actinocorallia sp. A-T 12471]